MRSLAIGLLALAALAGCSRAGGPSVAAGSSPAPAAPASDKSGAAGPMAPALPQLAYTYQAQVEAASSAIPDLLARHEAACLRAGPALCQVTGAERASERDGAHAELKLRAQPAWLQVFRDGLANDVRPLGGRLVSTTTASEDLTRQMVDTDAALRAKTALADRLQQLLATRDGKLSDLLDVEKALAETQGEIDAARSELAVMRGRVATSELTLTYASRPSFASVWRPVGDAAQGSVGLFAQAVALLIVVVAALLPFALAAAATAFLWRAWRRRRPSPPAKRGGPQATVLGGPPA